MPALDRIAEVLLIGLILLTPLPLGAVGPTAVFAFSSVAAVLACGVLPRRGPFPTLGGGSTGVTRAAASVVCLAALLPLAPLPAGLVRFLSPAAASLRDAVPGGTPSWMTLSVHPGATSTALARLAIYAAIFLGSAALASHGSTHRRILAAVFASGLFQAAYGSAEYLTGHQYILFSPKRYYLEDATGTYINKNHFAGLLEMALPVGLGLLLDRLQRSEKRGPSRGLRSRLVALVALVGLTSNEGARSVTLSAGVAVMGLGLFLSHSRSGIAGAALGILLVSWTSLRRARTARVRPLILGAGVVLAAVVLVTGLERVLSESSRLLTAATLVEGRLPVWRDCLSIASRFPLFGTGPGTFRDIYPAYRTMTGEVAYDHAHNDALELLVETGLSGSMLLLLLLLLFGRSVIRGLRIVPAPVSPYFLGASAGATALLFHEATDFNLHIPANAIVFSVLTGTCAGLAFAPGQRLALVGNTGEHAVRARAPGTRADLVRALAVCLIFVAVLKLYENSRADRLFAEYKKIGANSAAGLSPPAERRRIELLGRVIATRDLGSKAHAALALELASMAEREILADGAEDGRRGATDTHVEAALREVETALRENPTEIEAWFSGFHVAAHAALLGRPNTGEPGLAQRFIDGAIRCDPTSGRLRMRFALELLALGNVEKAREMFHEALLRPGVDPHVAARQMLEGGLSPAAVLEAIPETFPALLTAAIVLRDAEHADEAEQAFLKAARADPRSHVPWAFLSRLADSQGQPRQGLEYALHAYTSIGSLTASARSEMLFCAALANVSLGDRSGALSEASMAIKDTPRDPALRDFTAGLLLQAGRTGEAIEHWRFLLEELSAEPWVEQHQVDVRKRLAHAYETAELYASALAQHLEVLRLRPDDPESRDAIARLASGTRRSPD